MLKKFWNVAAAFFVLAAGSLCFAPVRAWASQEGSYLYHQFFLNGPAVFYGAGTSYTGSDNTARQGVYVTTGTPAAMTGVFSLRFLGAQSSKPATSTEGDCFYDTTNHTLVFSTCTASNTSCWAKPASLSAD